MNSLQFSSRVAWVSFTVRFLQMRKQLNLTQQQMAKAVGIRAIKVNRYEPGEASPSVDIMNSLQFSSTVAWMSFTVRFLQLRKQHNLTQQQMAEVVGIHVTQVKRYESGEAQPSVDILKKIAVAFNVTADWLIFEEGEREPQDDLKLKFEAVSQMGTDEQQAVIQLIDAMILKQRVTAVLQPQGRTK